MTTMIRPFREFATRGAGLPAIEIRGEIRQRSLVVHAFGQKAVLPLDKTGVDGTGIWGIVRESEVPLRDGFRVRVEVEYDEDLPACTCLQIFQEHARAQTIRERLPNAMVIIPVDRSISVYFRPDGSVEAVCDGLESPGRLLN